MSSAVKTAGKEDFTRERVAQDPEHIVSFEGLEAVDGKDDVALQLEDVLEAGLVGQAQSEQFFVAFEKVGDGTLGDGNLALLEGAMDFRDGAMLTIAQGA